MDQIFSAMKPVSDQSLARSQDQSLSRKINRLVEKKLKLTFNNVNIYDTKKYFIKCEIKKLGPNGINFLSEFPKKVNMEEST